RAQPGLDRRPPRLRLRALRSLQGRRPEVRPLARRGADAASAGRRRRHRPGMTHYKSKSLVTWIARVGGSLGLHRFYLYGFRDTLGWLHPLPTLLGALGIERVLEF